MIIGTHALSTCRIDQASSFLYITQTFCVYGVNLFMLISGYFMVKRKEASMLKILKLLLDVAFYGVIMYGISVAIGLNTFSITGLVKAAVPMLAGYRWFVVAYIVVYSLSPFINTTLQHLSKHSYLTLLLIYFVFFSLWPSFLPHPPLDDYGYSFNHLIFVYLIGGYIRLHMKNVKLAYCIVALVLCFAATTAIFCLDGVSIPFVSTLFFYNTAYNSVFVLGASIALFLMFTKLSFSNRAVNVLASSAFAVFLMHGDYNMMGYLFSEVFHMAVVYTLPIWFLIFPLYMAFIYLVFALIDQVKQHTVDKLLNRILKQITFVNYIITASEE